MTAFVLQEVTKEAITPSRVYLSALLSADVRPFCLSHCLALSRSHSASSSAFLHSPMGALVSSLSFLMASRGTLMLENHLLVKRAVLSIIILILVDDDQNKIQISNYIPFILTFFLGCGSSSKYSWSKRHSYLLNSYFPTNNRRLAACSGHRIYRI